MLIIGIVDDDTGTDKSANYTFEVLVNDQRIYAGKVEGHNRSDNWQKLIAKLLNQNGLPIALIGEAKVRSEFPIDWEDI